HQQVTQLLSDRTHSDSRDDSIDLGTTNLDGIYGRCTTASTLEVQKTTPRQELRQDRKGNNNFTQLAQLRDVPSMHICCRYTIELLEQARLRRFRAETPVPARHANSPRTSCAA